MTPKEICSGFRAADPETHLICIETLDKTAKRIPIEKSSWVDTVTGDNITKIAPHIHYPPAFHLIFRLLRHNDIQLHEAGRQVIEDKITAYNLSPKIIIPGWLASYTHDWFYPNDPKPNRNLPPFKFSYVLQNNLYVLDRLFNYDPDCPKKLHEQFGIICFGRYNPNVLIHQDQTANDPKSPYCVMLTAQDDWNGSAYFHWKLQTQLTRSLARISPPTQLRVFEGHNLAELLNLLATANERYNPAGKNKIIGGLIAAHGDPHHLSFSENGYEDLEIDNVFQYSSGFTNSFAPHASIIIRSCQAGAPRGIAQELSTLGFEVFATTQVAGVQRIRVRTDSNGYPHLFPTYRGGAKCVRYFRGELIESGDPNATL